MAEQNETAAPQNEGVEENKTVDGSPNQTEDKDDDDEPAGIFDDADTNVDDKIPESLLAYESSEEEEEEEEYEDEQPKKEVQFIGGIGPYEEIFGEFEGSFGIDEWGEGEEMHPSEMDEPEVKRVNFLEVETIHLGGDFTKSTVAIVDKRYDKVFDLDQEEEEEEEEEYFIEEEEEQQVEAEEEEFIIDRDKLYETYQQLFPGYNSIKMKNNFLQRKMVEYFTKRKMDHVMKEDANFEDNYAKYCKKLNVYLDLKNQNQKAKDEMLSAINIMKDQKVKQQQELNESLQKLYTHEKEIGTGLILAKTGKPVPEKLVERLVHNQMLKAEEMSNLRQHYIKIRDKIADLEAACAKFDKIGDHYTLMDYEQLKIERRNHTDKIEERDEELSRLRRQCSSAIQCLAHTREKLAAVQDKIYFESLQLTDVERDRTQIREILNGNKQQRDNYRAMTLKEKDNAGLLTKPKLLRDMEDTMNERDRLQAEMEELKALTEKYKKQIECVKAHVKEERKRSMSRKKEPKVVDTLSSSSASKRRIFKGRPSLLTIKESVCDDGY